MNKDDAELVRALRAGDDEAFAVLVRRHQAQLLRLARSMVPNRAVAEEAVQDTWLGVLRGIDTFEGRSSVRTWLFHILVNRAHTACAHEHRTVPVDPDAPPPGPRGEAAGADDCQDADERLSAEELTARLRPLLPALPEAQRQVFALHDVEGLPTAEVCRRLGLSPGNERVLLCRARARLRRLLDV